MQSCGIANTNAMHAFAQNKNYHGELIMKHHDAMNYISKKNNTLLAHPLVLDELWDRIRHLLRRT